MVQDWLGTQYINIDKVDNYTRHGWKIRMPEPKGPQTSREKVDEEVRKNLEAILESAQAQFQERVKSAGGYEEYCRKIKHKLYVQAIFGKDAFK